MHLSPKQHNFDVELLCNKFADTFDSMDAIGRPMQDDMKKLFIEECFGTIQLPIEFKWHMVNLCNDTNERAMTGATMLVSIKRCYDKLKAAGQWNEPSERSIEEILAMNAAQNSAAKKKKRKKTKKGSERESKHSNQNI